MCNRLRTEPAVERMAATIERTCTWTLDEIDGAYEASCGETWALTDGTPKENNYKFCPGCGGRIVGET